MFAVKISHWVSVVLVIICWACKIDPAKKDPVSFLNPDRLERIHQVQQHMIDEGKVGSNQVLIYKAGEIAYNHIVNSGHQMDAAISDSTIFPLWSMTKPITTVAAMMLFERGKFLLSDPIEDYLPEMKGLQCLDEEGNIYPCKKSVTVLDLLAHQSGWGYYPRQVGGKYLLITDSVYADLEHFTREIAGIPLQFEPGSRYLYGVNTSILGRLIEVVSQMTLSQFLEENIFNPLEMKDTKFYLTPDERKLLQPLHRLQDGRSHYFHSQFDELSYKQTSKVPFGGAGLVSTTKDYSHFCEMLVNGGVYQGHRLISPLSLQWMKQAINPELEQGTFVGCSTGFSLFNMTNPLKSGGLSPQGIFGWGGYHGTLFWIDLENQLYGLVMCRTSYPAREMFSRIRTATYQALVKQGTKPGLSE